MVMAFNPDDPHDGHAAVDDGFTYRMVHIGPEFLASLTGTPLPLFRSPVIEDPAVAASVRRLHRGAHRAGQRAGTVRAARRDGPAAGQARLRAEPARPGADGGADRRGRTDPRAHPGQRR